MTEQDNSIKQLFVVEVTYRAYVFADDASDAREFINEIKDTELENDVIISKVDSNVLDWPTHFLVYTDSDKEIDLHTALEITANKN